MLQSLDVVLKSSFWFHICQRHVFPPTPNSEGRKKPQTLEKSSSPFYPRLGPTLRWWFCLNVNNWSHSLWNCLYGGRVWRIPWFGYELPLPLPVSQSVEYLPASVFIGEKLGTARVTGHLLLQKPQPVGSIITSRQATGTQQVGVVHSFIPQFLQHCCLIKCKYLNQDSFCSSILGLGLIFSVKLMCF